MSDTKLIGDLSERMVSVELLKLGLNVLEPVGDRLWYDLAIDLNGKLVRVQVRTAWYDSASDLYIGNVRSTKTNRAEYKCIRSDTTRTEFFVFVVQTLAQFYVVPAATVLLYKSSITFSPHRVRLRDSHRIESYKNAWILLNNADGPVPVRAS